jgi:hypothetical protein
MSNGKNPGDDGDATKTAGTNVDDANDGNNAAKNKSAKPVDGDGGDDSQPKGKFMTDDAINSIVQQRLARARKDDEEAAKRTREQQLEFERDQARNELRVSNTRDEFITSSGIGDYGKASRLFRMYSNDLEFDDAGKCTNLKDVLSTAKKEWPEMFGKVPPGSGDLGGGQGGGGGKPAGSNMNDLIRRAAGRK